MNPEALDRRVGRLIEIAPPEPSSAQILPELIIAPLWRRLPRIA